MPSRSANGGPHNAKKKCQRHTVSRVIKIGWPNKQTHMPHYIHAFRRLFIERSDARLQHACVCPRIFGAWASARIRLRFVRPNILISARAALMVHMNDSSESHASVLSEMCEIRKRGMDITWISVCLRPEINPESALPCSWSGDRRKVALRQMIHVSSTLFEGITSSCAPRKVLPLTYIQRALHFTRKLLYPALHRFPLQHYYFAALQCLGYAPWGR